MKSLRLPLHSGLGLMWLMAGSLTPAQAFSPAPVLTEQQSLLSNELLTQVQYDPRQRTSNKPQTKPPTPAWPQKPMHPTMTGGGKPPAYMKPSPNMMGSGMWRPQRPSYRPPMGGQSPNMMGAGVWRPQRPSYRPPMGGQSIAPVMAAGALGLAAGSIIAQTHGQAQARPVYAQAPRPRPVYGPNTVYVPQAVYVPQPVYRPEPVYQNQTIYQSYPVQQVYEDQTASLRPEPWSEEWYDYCVQRYRTFNPNNGTYLAYDGHRYFCR